MNKCSLPFFKSVYSKLFRAFTCQSAPILWSFLHLSAWKSSFLWMVQCNIYTRQLSYHNTSIYPFSPYSNIYRQIHLQKEEDVYTACTGFRNYQIDRKIANQITERLYSRISTTNTTVYRYRYTHCMKNLYHMCHVPINIYCKLYANFQGYM